MIWRDLAPPVQKTLWMVKVVARVSLGLVWIYEGLVPKIIFVNALPEQMELVRRSALFWPTPRFTLIALGIAQIIAGMILVIGWAERAAVLVTTLGLCILVVLVATGRPSMLADPFGALVKDLCLISSAITVWLLAPVLAQNRKS